MQEFTPKTRKRLRPDAVKSTHLKYSCHRTGTTTAPHPKPECDLRCQRCTQDPPKSHLQNKQEHHSPTKRNAVACPHNGSGLPPTGPSPGANPPIYPSSLPLASGNPLSNISPQSHGFFFFSYLLKTQRACWSNRPDSYVRHYVFRNFPTQSPDCPRLRTVIGKEGT
jgi:hypothetical protein